MNKQQLFDRKTIFLTILICLSSAVIAGLVILNSNSGPAGLSSEIIKSYAQELQNNQLYRLAIIEYDKLAGDSALAQQKRSNINYIIGKMYLEELLDYENALASFLKAKQDDESGKLAKDLDKLIVECLEKMGRRSAAQFKMEQATALKGKPANAGDIVLAKIGKREISLSELNSAIEELPVYLQESLKQPEKKLGFLQQYVTNELLSEAAVRKGLDKEPWLNKKIAGLRKQLLGERIYQEEVRSKVNIGQSELQSYFESHQNKYSTPASVSIAHIQVKTEKEASNILDKLNKGADFTKLATENSLDARTKDKSGKLGTITADGNIPKLGHYPEIAKTLREAKQGGYTGPVKIKDFYHVFKVLNKTEGKSPEFKEVRSRVESDLKSAKENELFSKYIQELNKAQKVVIYDDLIK